jgi:yeast amino acid transporter
VAVTAFEAASPRRSLRRPAKYIAWVIALLFFLCGLGEAINIPWNSPALPELGGNRVKSIVRAVRDTRASFSLLVLAAEQAGINGFPGFLNACLIFSCLSAANTALYVASRTLYGLCREIPENSPWPKRWAAKLGAIDPRTRVPFWALCVSLISFFWLPFLHLRRGYSIQEVSNFSNYFYLQQSPQWRLICLNAAS